MRASRSLQAETRNISYTLCHRAAYSTSGPHRTDKVSRSRRSLHSSPHKDAAIPMSHESAPATSEAASANTSSKATVAPLSNLPLSQILRTLLITSISSSPAALGASTKILQSMLESRNPLFRIDSNPLLRALLWETFYKQFCAGENATQVSRECTNLRTQGYAGVILEYALEVLKDADSDESQDIATWRQGMLDTVSMATKGDFVALKWSGMGPAAMRRMKQSQNPSAEMSSAMHAVCDLAASRDIGLLPAAEETWSLEGFHKWCLDLQREYNARIPGKAVVYSTYQAYLRQTPSTLASHLEIAKAERFTLGVKLVRGAYLGTEVRGLIHPSIEATHACYDGIMASVLQRGFNSTLAPVSGSSSGFPGVNLVIASHNAASVATARKLRGEQAARGEELTPTVYAQLQGMADEVSCALLAANRGESEGMVRERVLKYTTWGTMHQCLGYLIRRAAENKDAAGRTAESRRAVGREVLRRVGLGG